MTAPLRDLLDGVADDLSDDLAGAPTVDAHRVWTAGRRRRRARRVQGVAAGLAVVLLAVLLVPLDAARRPAEWAGLRAPAQGVDDFPARIGRQAWVRGLPDRPGPLSLLVQGWGGTTRWYGVGPDGVRWRLPEVAHRTDQWPALSPDGRLLGHLETEDGPYVLRDLVTGERLVVEGVSDARGLATAQHQLSGQVPTHWAPDSSRAVLPAVDQPVVLDVATGRLTPVTRPHHLSLLAGFSGADRLVWLRDPTSQDVRITGPVPNAVLAPSVTVVTTDLLGQVLAEVPLTTSGPATVSQWSGVVSPDGAQVALVSEVDAGVLPAHRVELFELSTGRRLVDTMITDPDVRVEGTCGAAWGERLVVPVAPVGRGGAGPLAVSLGGDAEPVVVVEDRDALRCAVWATGALTADGGRALLGTATGWLSWWWPELLAASVLLALAVTAARRRRAPGAPRTPGRRTPPPAAADWYA